MAIIERVNHGLVSGVRVGRFNKGINTTFVVYTYKDIIIDTGPINQWKYVSAFIGDHISKPPNKHHNKKEINHLLLTHHHEDHSGNAQNIALKYQIPVYSNSLCQQLVKQEFNIPLIQKILWGTAKPVFTETITDNFESKQGVKLRLIETPGHTEDMCCFYDAENGFLFTGDLYIASQVRYLNKDEDLTKQLHSLNKVLSLDFETAFCPHRGIMKNGKKDLTKKRDFIVTFAEQVKALAKQGMSTKQICKQLLGREDLFTLLSSFTFTKKGLIEACLTLPT